MEVATKPKVSAAALPSGKLVELYIQLRDRRALRKAEYENADADDKGKQEKIEGILLQRFNEEGIDSIKTGAGTAQPGARGERSVAGRVWLCWHQQIYRLEIPRAYRHGRREAGYRAVRGSTGGCLR